MIKKQELRYGNLVLDDKNNEVIVAQIRRVTIITKAKISPEKTLKYDEIFPVPLKQWIEKNEYKIQEEKPSENHFELYKYVYIGNFKIWFLDGAGFSVNKIYDRGTRFFNSLHYLQNVFLFNTGRELLK